MAHSFPLSSLPFSPRQSFPDFTMPGMFFSDDADDDGSGLDFQRRERIIGMRANYPHVTYTHYL